MVGAENYSFLVGVGSRGFVMHLLDDTPAFFLLRPCCRIQGADATVRYFVHPAWFSIKMKINDDITAMTMTKINGDKGLLKFLHHV